MVLAGALAASTAARAFDDRPSAFDPVLNVIGLGKDSEDKPDIDFRERPKLVVPKDDALPPPVAGARSRAANWPVDPDVRRRKEAEIAARAPRDMNRQLTANPALSAEELKQGRTAGPSNNPEVCPTRRNGACTTTQAAPSPSGGLARSRRPTTTTSAPLPSPSPVKRPSSRTLPFLVTRTWMAVAVKTSSPQRSRPSRKPPL